MNKIKVCIFDLDGVICDTAKYHFLAWKQLANELQISFTKEDNERLKGVSREESLNVLLSLGTVQYTSEEKQNFLELKNGLYVDFIMKMKEDEILPGVLDMFEFCKKQNIKIVLGSVSKNAMTILDKLSLGHYFDAIIDGTKVKNPKPDPEVFLKGAEEVSANPAQCVVFEDAKSGIEAARRAKMKVVGIGQATILDKADYVVADFLQMRPQEIIAKLYHK